MRERMFIGRRSHARSASWQRSLITGAGSGIGEAIAVAMVREGARIVPVDINIGAAVRVARTVGENAVGLACDVTDRAACDELAAKVRTGVGPVSVLVNNAGIIRRGKVTDTNSAATGTIR